MNEDYETTTLLISNLGSRKKHLEEKEEEEVEF